MAGAVTAMVLALDLTRSAWGSRPPAGQDTMALLIRTEHGLGLLASGRLDGWLPHFALGYQEFLFYGPGHTFLIGLTRIVSLGSLSSAGGYKVVALASLALFPLTVVWVARSAGLSHFGAGMAAVLSLLVSNPLGVGVHAVFENSLIAQQIGACLVFVALGGVLRILVDPRPAWAVTTGVALAALLVTHLISTVLLGLLLLVAVPTSVMIERPKPCAVKRLAAAGVLGAGLAGFWLVPLVAHRDLRGPVATWGTPPLPDRLGEIWRGTFLFRPHVAQVLAAASLYALYHLTRQRRWAALALAVPLGFVLVSRFLLHRYPGDDLVIQIENRGIGMAAVIATFPLAELAGAAATRLRSPLRPLTVLAAGGLVLTMVATTIEPWRAVAQQMPEGTPSLRAAAAALSRIVPPGARWVAVREFPDEVETTGVVHPDFWLAHRSRRWTANSFNPESSSGPTSTGDRLLNRPPDEVARDLARLGVVAVVATTPVSTGQLETSSSFRPAWSDGPITIFDVVVAEGQPAPSSLIATVVPATAILERASSQHLRMTVLSSAPTVATVAVAWSPKWHLRLDGRRAPIDRTSDGIIQVQLPAGSTRVELDYSRDVWDAIGLAISLATAAGLGAWRRRRRSGRASETDPEPGVEARGET